MDNVNDLGVKGGVVDIAEVISSINAIGTGMTEIIKSTTKDMAKILAIDTKPLVNNTSTLNNLTKTIKDYITNVKSILDTIVENNINTTLINNILDYYEVYDPKNPTKVVKTEMRLLTSINLIAKFLTDVSKSVSDLAKIDTSFKDTIIIRRNVQQLNKSISSIVNSMLSTFTNKDNNEKIKQMMGILASDPEVIEQINDIQKNIDESGKDSNHRFIDESYDRSRTITTKTRIGLLEGITTYLGFAQLISSLRVPLPIVVSFKISMLNRSLTKIINSMSNLAAMIGDKEHVQKFEAMNKSLSEIQTTFKNLPALANTVAEFSIVSILIYSIASTAFDNWLGVEGKKTGILTRLLNVRTTIENTWSKYNKKPIDNVTSYVGALTEIVKVLSLLSLFAINPFVGVGIDILTGTKRREGLLSKIARLAGKLSSKQFDILDDKVVDRLSSITDLMNNLKSLATSILAVSVLAILAAPATIIVSLFMISLTPMIILIGGLAKLIQKMNIEDISRSVLSMIYVCGLFGVVALTLITLQLIVVHIHWNVIWADILLLGAVITGIALITAGISLLFGKSNSLEMTETILSLIGICGLLVVAAVAMLALQYTLTPIKWKDLIINIGLMMLVVSVVGALCWVVGFFTVIFAPVITGLIALTLVIGSLLLTAIMLKKLTTITFTKDEMLALVANDDEEGVRGKGVIRAVMEVLKSISQMLRETPMLNLISLTLITTKLTIIIFTLSTIFLISKILKSISDIKDIRVGEWGALSNPNPNDSNSTKMKGTILGNVSAILNIVGLIGYYMTRPPQEGGSEVSQDRGLLGGIISLVSPELSNLVSSLLNFGTLVFTLMNVGCIYLTARILMSISDININTQSILDKVDSIIECVRGIYRRITNTDNTSKRLDEIDKGGGSKWSKFWSKVKTIVSGPLKTIGDVVGNLVGAGVLATALPNIIMLGKIVDIINNINTLNIDEKSVGEKVDSILSITKSISEKVNSESDITTIDSKKVESFHKFADDNVKLFKGINDLKIENVTSLKDLYAQMTEFMNSIKDLDIDSLTDALVNKIGPALESIDTSVNNIGAHKQETVQKIEEKERVQEKQQAETNTDVKDIIQTLEDIKRALVTNGIIVQGLT